MHRIGAADGFWSVRVNRDVRIVLHKEGDRVLLAYVAHHDEAYAWAERKRLIPHERTGAMQFVEVPVVAGEEEQAEPLLDDARSELAEKEAASPPVARNYPFAGLTDDQMLDVGVPRDWLQPVRDTEEAEVDALFDKLPQEAAEALLDHATGGRIEDHVAEQSDGDPYAHPDAQRRFRTVDNLDELKAALDQPFEKWAVFLHPVQRALVARDWSGPARVSGSAGTGKTIVALHRAAHLARAKTAKVLLTTFSKSLADALSAKCGILTESTPDLRDRITVRALDQAAYELYTQAFGQPNLATSGQIRTAITDAQKAGLGEGLTAEFLFEEWEELVDAWNVIDADHYAEVPRVGRRIRLGSRQREAAWSVFDFVRQRLASRGVVTWAALYARLADFLRDGGAFPFTHVVVDEAQDLSVAQVKFLAAVGAGREDALFLAGDIGQRIFHLPFSWARLGLDIRGRSHCLRVNYRTTHQIRAAADRLLPPAITDMDGVEEGRRGTVSVFDGPVPILCLADDDADERREVARFLSARLEDGVQPGEIGVLVRAQGQLARARAAVLAAGLDPRAEDGVRIVTMHDAKGLEFRTVVVMACDEDVLPDPARLGAIGDIGEMEAAYETERHLLYVACTRARDHLLVSGVTPGSEFLEDMELA
ncbi:3'-5' exonuclease [Stakelama saccharophila]|uniref:DNA 3'-5' helicase n=1 Tax=Stakelama saccharophila TaxID=3075605 RepID=A0ABZ0BCR4_9SPHN|nr:3'-5' exonuclease [Stakelama sp. W311]WNO55184.1 3'-5' exonuclease [Stakelama sp. W311]